MEVFFKPSFIKDLKKLPCETKNEVKNICYEIFPSLNNLKDIKDGYKIKSIQGFKNYYRIKLGNYRVGFKKENENMIFMRVMHRKDIYKNFP